MAKSKAAAKRKLSFSDEETERIICLWSTKEVLFNCSHEDYFKKDARATALADIVLKADIPDLTTDELWKKMSCLRTYYGKEIGKERATKVSGTGTKDVYVSKWPYFKLLHFLRDNITPRKTTSTCTIQDREACTISDDQQESSVDGNGFDDENTCVFNISNPPSCKNKKKMKTNLEDDLLETCLQELKKPKTDTPVDADATFGQFIAKQMQRIPDGYAKEMLRIDIQQLILKAMLPQPPARQPFSTIAFADLE